MSFINNWDKFGTMATFTKRGDLQWQAKVRRKGYPTKTMTFDTHDDAKLWAATIESQMGRGLFQDLSEAERTTIYDALDRYKREISAHKKSMKAEEYRIGQLQQTDVAKHTLASAKSSVFAKYRDERLKEVSAATVRLDLALFSHLYTIANKEWQMGIPSNPVMGIRMPKIKNARDRRFQGDEEKRLMASLDDCKNKWVKPIVQMAIETGARMGELRKLEWQHVDLKNCTATAFDTKNGDDRVIPLSPRARAVLKALPRTDDQELVFPISKDSVSHAFSNACVRAEIKDFKFHDLRHEAVSRLFEADLNIMEVASVSGHKTVGMLKRYTHMHARKIADKLSIAQKKITRKKSSATT